MGRVFFIMLSVLALTACGPSREERLSRAQAELERGDREAARARFLALLSEEPADPDAIQGMVSITQISGATEENYRWRRELLRFRPWDRESNIVVGRRLMEEGELENAAVRFFLAYQSSDFIQDKREALELLHLLRRRSALEHEGTDSP